MAKTVNNVKINSAFTTAASREQLTSGENLCTSLGKINKYLADLDSGAFTFPADGGNSDTVDGLHASDIQIDAVSDTAELVTLDNLQGGVPFSEIAVSGKNIFYGQLVVGMVGTTTGVIDSTSPSTTRYLSTTNLIPVKPNTQYTAQNAENKTLDAVVYYDENESLIGNTYIGAAGLNSFTTPDNCKFVRWRYLFDSVQSDTSGLTNIQLEVGDTATEYEPPIIGQEITLTACGKNLIPYPYSRSNGIYNGITINISDDGKFSASGVATAGFTLITFADQDKPIKLVAGRIYTISCSKPYDINNFNLFFRIYHTDGTYSGVTSYPTTFIAKDGDYITGSLWVDEGTSFNVSNVSIQIELGDTTTEYEPYSGTTVTITPDSNPYTVPNDIRQQEGTNNVSVSVGKISVTGVKKNAAIKKIWDNKADLSDIQIDAVSATAGIVTLDGLQGGVPFSSITVSGKNLITQVLSAALGGNSTDGFRITDNPYCRSFVRKLLPNTTYTVKRYDNGNRFRIILFNEYPTITADTTANQILNATTTPNEWTFTTGTDHLWFALTTHNGATDNTVVEPIVQLEYGDTTTEYEPPIVGQEITLTACGKNLLKYPYVKTTSTINGITFTDNGDGSITMNGTAAATTWCSNVQQLRLQKGKQYCFSTGTPATTGASPTDNGGYTMYLSFTENAGDSVAKRYEFPNVGSENIVFTANYNYANLSIRVENGAQLNNVTFKPQLEIGGAATEYEPYSGSTVTITPDSNPYTVSNDIRQQDGVNNISISAGEVSVTGVKKSPVINSVWEELDSHTNNTIVHVTAEEKAAWNGKFDYIGVVHDLFAVNKTCVCAYDTNTLNTPFSSGLTLSGAGLCFVNYVAGAEYATYLVISSGDTNHYAATSNNGSEHVKWHKISDGGNADTVDGKHAVDIMNMGNFAVNRTLIEENTDLNTMRVGGKFVVNSKTVAESCRNTPFTESGFYFDVVRHSSGNIMQIATLWTGKTKIRNSIDAASWNEWVNISDGGNADTVDGLHANEIASNPNLLINPNFKINQRGQSEYTGSKNYLYTVDCWRVGFGNGIAKSLKVESDGVVFGSTTDKQYLVQLIENSERLIGDYTLTFCVSEITGSAVIQFVENNVTSSSAVIRKPGVYSVTITLSGTGTTVARRIQLQSEVGATVKVRWAKLESGRIATPFCPPDPATELAKCQRYYEILTIPTKTPIIGVRVNNLMLPTITYSVPKRIETPTVLADEAYPVRFSDNAGVFGALVKKAFTGFFCTSSSMTGYFMDVQENKIDAGQMGYIADPVKIIINAEL